MTENYCPFHSFSKDDPHYNPDAEDLVKDMPFNLSFNDIMSYMEDVFFEIGYGEVNYLSNDVAVLYTYGWSDSEEAVFHLRIRYSKYFLGTIPAIGVIYCRNPEKYINKIKKILI